MKKVRAFGVLPIIELKLFEIEFTDHHASKNIYLNKSQLLDVKDGTLWALRNIYHGYYVDKPYVKLTYSVYVSEKGELILTILASPDGVPLVGEFKFSNPPEYYSKGFVKAIFKNYNEEKRARILKYLRRTQKTMDIENWYFKGRNKLIFTNVRDHYVDDDNEKLKAMSYDYVKMIIRQIADVIEITELT